MIIIFLTAVLIRLLVLPFTLKTEKHFAVMRLLYRNLNKCFQALPQKRIDNQIEIPFEEIYAIDKTLNHIQKYRRPLYFIIPIVFQATIGLFLLWAYSYSNWKAEFLWISDISVKDPYFLIPLVFMITLIIRHYILFPHKRKFVLIVPALFLCFVILNRAAALPMYLICLIFISTVQTAIMRRRYAFSSAADLYHDLSALSRNSSAEMNSPAGDSNNDYSNSREWLCSFKKKASIFLYDDVLMSLLAGFYLGLAGAVVFLMYWAYFHWRQKQEWRKWAITIPILNNK